MYEQQTYSSDPNLGAEIDLSVYYRTENGPQFTDGFFVAGQFGISSGEDVFSRPAAARSCCAWSWASSSEVKL